eukprot:CAMPEP_0195281262 /NCGR_PEP_ID=MMETSP0707-20130614/645_1 /TAXON_ID=33640 /ORGANISM="Asterionellopsis glacialis, Strain CCMP134" /LENGTH=851 /DNA_ID=CAMNT_0040340133 /DNA_START=33 /DNA_END=2588 /DNA_ORIENTATION=-
MSQANEGSRLLEGNGSHLSISDDSSSSLKGSSMLKGAVVGGAIVGIFWFGISLLSGDTSITASSKQDISKVVYRPTCETYGSKSSVEIFQTSKDEPSRQWTPISCSYKGTPDLNAYGLPDANIQVDSSKLAFADRKNPIMGFGGAFTEAAALNYKTLSEEGQEAVIELLFGKSGLGYSVGRVHMNSCDFSVKSYSFDDTDGDFELKDFDTGVEHDVKSGMVDMMTSATAKAKESWGASATGDSADYGQDGYLKILASPWSPPAWMKAPTESDAEDALHAENMTFSVQPSCLREGTGPDSRYAKSWALFFAKFITAYSDLGIDFFAVTVQNEPEFPAPWEACSYTPETQGDFLTYHLGPTLRELHPDVKIFMFDHNKDHAPAWANYLLKSENPASKFIDGTGIHWYAGGMDRLMDGAVGMANMHRLIADMKRLNVKSDHIILGSEACHCPSTGYAGGDINVAWYRAERYAHTILADLAAGSNGWVEWNLVLDTEGGPNHLGNMCDGPILAAPHRAEGSTAVRTEMGYDIPPFEEHDHPFGPIVGDLRTREELDALGFPAKYLDKGVVVQPLYFYMGHISRHVRPGSKAVMALVEQSDKGQIFRPEGQHLAGGGINDLARDGIELTTWPCEGSTRQQFKMSSDMKLQVFGHDWLGRPTRSCLANQIDTSFEGLVMMPCEIIRDPEDEASEEASDEESDEESDEALPAILEVIATASKSDTVYLRLANVETAPEESCLTLTPPRNEGGAYGPRGGGQVTIGSCKSPAAEWTMTEDGEITSTFFSEGDLANEVCITTGWPFLQVGAFDTPNGSKKNTVVVLNEAAIAANYALKDGDDLILTASIPAHSIQTINLD